MKDYDLFITPEGQQAIQAEIAQLWKEERPQVTEEVRIAAAHGDRSENAEYQYGKKRLREIDRRLRFLGGRLKKLKVQRPPHDPQGRVEFGCWVRVEDEEERERIYRLVGTDETAPEAGKISVRSPIGRALMGKLEDDTVVVDTPRGELELSILEVSSRPLQAETAGECKT